MKQNIIKNMVYAIIPAIAIVMSGCSKSDIPQDSPKDWDNTSGYSAYPDAAGAGTYYKPAVGDVADPMPFYDPIEKDFKIMYLQNYRPNQAITYHPIWCVSTTEPGTYQSLGELIPCGSEEELDAAIGTGSTVYNEKDGLYYTFYTGHTDREVVMFATSGNFRTWTKNRSVYIKGEDNGFSRTDFRDPLVFEGEDGLWHMVVSTKKNGKGHLAEYTSENLKEWTCKGTFMTMLWDRFYECPDIFKMGDWWYLIYSEIHDAVRKVQYFKGRTLDELKNCTANESSPVWPDNKEGFLDSRCFYAGKTASDGTDRYIWGWCPIRLGETNTNAIDWAGNLVVHRLVQNEDGTLTLGAVPSVDRKYSTEKQVKEMKRSGTGVTAENDGSFSLEENSFILFNRLGVCNRISFTVKTDGPDDKFGISLVRGSDSEKFYSLIINPEGSSKRKINFEEEGGTGFIANSDSYLFDTPSDNTYDIVIYTDNSVCVMYINDKVAYTDRIYGMARNCWSVNCYDGGIKVSDLKVSQQ